MRLHDVESTGAGAESMQQLRTGANNKEGLRKQLHTRHPAAETYLLFVIRTKLCGMCRCEGNWAGRAELGPVLFV